MTHYQGCHAGYLVVINRGTGTNGHRFAVHFLSFSSRCSYLLITPNSFARCPCRCRCCFCLLHCFIQHRHSLRGKCLVDKRTRADETCMTVSTCCQASWVISLMSPHVRLRQICPGQSWRLQSKLRLHHYFVRLGW